MSPLQAMGHGKRGSCRAELRGKAIPEFGPGEDRRLFFWFSPIVTAVRAGGMLCNFYFVGFCAIVSWLDTEVVAFPAAVMPARTVLGADPDRIARHRKFGGVSSRYRRVLINIPIFMKPLFLVSQKFNFAPNTHVKEACGKLTTGSKLIEFTEDL